jgi:hypothetical protein
MKRRQIFNLGLFLIVVAFGYGSVYAQCSNATIVGTYRYIWTGYGSFGGNAEPPLRPNGPFTPFAAVGLTTFSADGTSSNTDTIQLAGGVFKRSFTNTFQVGSDCRGTITAQGATEPTANIVVAPDGSEILFINSFPGVVISGTYKRQ